jgi:ABC-type molybdate transport system substrate-binding protein
MAQVKVITSGGFAAVLQEILPEFEKATGIAVTIGRGPSPRSPSASPPAVRPGLKRR